MLYGVVLFIRCLLSSIFLQDTCSSSFLQSIFAHNFHLTEAFLVQAASRFYCFGSLKYSTIYRDQLCCPFQPALYHVFKSDCSSSHLIYFVWYYILFLSIIFAPANPVGFAPDCMHDSSHLYTHRFSRNLIIPCRTL